MPGICGIVGRSPSVDLESTLCAMVRRLTHYPWYAAEAHVAPGGTAAVARVSLGLVNCASQPVCNRQGTLTAVMDGELYDYTEQRARLTAAGYIFAGNSHAEVLLHGYAREGTIFFRGLEGTFSAALWDAAAEQITLFNDRFGMKPLYYAHPLGKFLFASEIKALLTDDDVPRERNMRGLAQFFTFGHLLGEDTLLESVRLLPPAAHVVYDVRADRLTVDRYWRLSAPGAQPANKADVLDQVDAAFQRAVDRRVNNTSGLGIALSGGLDGRTILAAIDHGHVPLKSVCMGVQGSLDHSSARQLARLTNRDHHEYLLDAQFLAGFEDHLRWMVHLTDGHYLDQCICVPMLPYYRQLGIKVLLRGHAGELMHMDKAYNFSLDRDALAIDDGAALKSWLSPRLCAYMLSELDGPLFAAMSRSEMDALADESLDLCLAESADVQPQLQRVAHLFITQRLRRETAMSLAMFGSVLETRVPFLDGGLVDRLMTIPPELKLGDALQSHLLRRRLPAFLGVINSNTGAPMGAGRLTRSCATLRMKVLGKLGVRGYQPYERLGLWLRRELRQLVEEVLLCDRCLDRGILHSDAVRRVVKQHFANQRNHTALLMALLIYELGARELTDQSHFTASTPVDGAPS